MDQCRGAHWMDLRISINKENTFILMSFCEGLLLMFSVLLFNVIKQVYI
jgi:hypothetical protein